MTAWSYSSVKTFDQCPRKYYHLRVAKDVKDTGNETTVYGQEVHKAAENYFLHGWEVPEKYKIIKPAVEAMAQFPGEVFTELRLGVREDLTPCEFFDDDVWYRGVVDLLIINKHKARMVDWKTGKSSRYADVKQLDLMAGAVFANFPEVGIIKSGLVFLVPGDFIKKTHVRTEKTNYFKVFDKQLDNLESAMESGVFNAKSSPLCGWCPVESCEHWVPRRSK